ncbi:TetR/AcrR family transcriptional regulator [Psychromonas hadalis]|uniref:TetR/AcrR family transcriptional regulator n=1 Tax=Psychromonas hadalis TaxID=211669 RepID=UPI0003B6403A|nr:TetR/AcrR family transcriptional regulator [Psychromonas hadalis]
MNNKKRHIIEVAFSLFYQKGIHAVGINEIIKTASIAKKTLYNHFVSKDELIIATLIYRDQLELTHLKFKLEQAEIGKDALLALFELLDDFINHRDTTLGNFRGDYFNNSCAEYGQSNQLVYATCQSHKEAIKNIIQTHINAFEQNPEKNQFLVNTLCLLKEGVINQALVQGDTNSALDATACVENLLRFKR